MIKANLITRCLPACLSAWLSVALLVTEYAHAAEKTVSSTPLASLLELKEPALTLHAPLIQDWKLRQGTRVLFVEKHDLPMVDLHISFAAGSHYEGNTPGLAAMTLSMLNEGSTLKDAQALARAFDQLGVNVENGISTEQSHFTLRTLSSPEIRLPAMALLAEMLSQPSFTESGLRHARHELETRLKLDQIDPQSRAHALVHKALYVDDPLLNPMYGTLDGLKRIDTTQVRAFYRRAYTATNAQIVIVGDLSREQAQVLSQTLSDALPSGPALPVSGALVASTNTGTTLHLQESTTQTLLMMGHNSLPDHHPDALAVRISNVIFNQILNKQLRELHSVTYGVLSDINHAKGQTPWVIHLSLPPHYSQATIAQIKALFAQYIKEGPSKEQLDDIKKYIRKALPQLTATNASLRNELVIINRFDQSLNFTHKTQAIQNMTPAHIRGAMSRHFKTEGWVSVTVGPQAEQLPLPERTRPQDSTQSICTSTNWASFGAQTTLGRGPMLWQLKHTPLPRYPMRT